MNRRAAQIMIRTTSGRIVRINAVLREPVYGRSPIGPRSPSPTAQISGVLGSDYARFARFAQMNPAACGGTQRRKHTATEAIRRSHRPEHLTGRPDHRPATAAPVVAAARAGRSGAPVAGGCVPRLAHARSTRATATDRHTARTRARRSQTSAASTPPTSSHVDAVFLRIHVLRPRPDARPPHDHSDPAEATTAARHGARGAKRP
jgi:hypothetical protein